MNCNDVCSRDSGKKYKKYRGSRAADQAEKKYVNEAHEWMDQNVLHGSYPDQYGYLILVDHDVPAEEIWNQLQYWFQQYLNFGKNCTAMCHRIIDQAIEYQIKFFFSGFIFIFQILC